MANPPVVIGSFANVPAPGSPIKSDWPQEISSYVQALGRGLIGQASLAAAQTIPGGYVVTDVTGVSVTWTPFAAGRNFRISVKVDLSKITQEGDVFALVTNGSNGVTSQAAEHMMLGAAGAIYFSYIETNLPATAQTRKLRVSSSTNSVTVNAGVPQTFIVVEDVGAYAGLPA